MRAKVAALVGFCLVGGGVAGQGDGKGDAKQIEGTWSVVSVEKAGKKKKTDEEDIRLIFKAGKLTFKKGEETKQGSYKITSTKKPKHIDLTVEDMEIHGIYELKGESLRICAAGPGDDRPAEFKSDEGSRSMILTLQREKKKKE